MQSIARSSLWRECVGCPTGRRGPLMLREMIERRAPEADNKRRFTQFVILDNDREREVIGRLGEEFDSAQIFPAPHPFFTLLSLVLDEKQEQIYEHRYSIIGWRIIAHDYPQPIAIGCDSGGPMTEPQIAAMRAYLRQWIDAP